MKVAKGLEDKDQDIVSATGSLPDQQKFHDWNGFLRAVLLHGAQRLAQRLKCKDLGGCALG